MTAPCGCSQCSGRGGATSLPTANRPGLDAIAYRAGTHATFLATMKARLSSAPHRAGLEGLMARDSSDPAIALLEGWATVADVLTFYQERIANEAYLRTAIDTDSVAHLAFLVGYEPRPGVASSVFLAYTVDKSSPSFTIRAGTRAQSVPADSNEKAQTFETSVDLEARPDWNNLQVRTTRPQRIGLRAPATLSARANLGADVVAEVENDILYVQGTSTSLKPHDLLLFTDTSGKRAAVKSIASITVEQEKNRIAIALDSGARPPNEPAPAPATNFTTTELFAGLLDSTVKSHPLPSQPIGTKGAFDGSRDVLPQILASFHPEAASAAYRALSTANVTPDPDVTVYPLTRAPLFGAAAPRVRNHKNDFTIETEWPFHEHVITNGAGAIGEGGLALAEGETPDDGVGVPDKTIDESDVIYLDGAREGIHPHDWLVLETDDTPLTRAGTVVVNAKEVRVTARAAFGLANKTTRIQLEKDGKPHDWLEVVSPYGYDYRDDTSSPHNFDAIRRTVVHIPGAPLALAEVPNPDPIQGAAIELDGIVNGLQAGRWIIVSGERDDIAFTPPEPEGSLASSANPPIKATKVTWSELARIAALSHGYDPDLKGDRAHTTLELAVSLGFSYKRDTVKIAANVVDATHGETKTEPLGSGDGTATHQSFTLKQPPLTFVSAATPSGVASTLQVLVNGLRWQERDSFFATGPRDRVFITRQDQDGKTKVTFGDGIEGSRLPTGQANVTARYRSGIGKAGNVKAEQIKTATDMSLGITQVINPIRASGGADRDTPSLVRQNAPASVLALGRLVSVEDYADFARVFAGIAKASAVVLSDGVRDWVHVTIAGIDDIPIDATSDLLRNLRTAMRRFGDPQQAFRVATRIAKYIVIDASIELAPDYPWETVDPLVRAALLDAFSFDRRQLGQPLHRSEILAAIHSVPGVACVKLGPLGLVTAADAKVTFYTKDDPVVRPAWVDRDADGPPFPMRPAEIAYLKPDVKKTLTLQEMKA